MIRNHNYAKKKCITDPTKNQGMIKMLNKISAFLALP